MPDVAWLCPCCRGSGHIIDVETQRGFCPRCGGAGRIEYALVLARAKAMHRLRDELGNAKFGGYVDVDVVARAESLVPTTSGRERRALAALCRDGRPSKSWASGLSSYLDRVIEWCRSLEYAGIAEP